MKYDLQKCLDVCPLCGGKWINISPGPSNLVCENCVIRSQVYLCSEGTTAYYKTVGKYLILWDKLGNAVWLEDGACAININYQNKDNVMHFDFFISEKELNKFMMLA